MHVFIAGAGGPLGKRLITLFLQKDFQVTAMGYSKPELAGLVHPRLTTLACDVTKPEQLAGLCMGVEVVVSCLGITRMRSQLSHYDVDYLGKLILFMSTHDLPTTKRGTLRFADYLKTTDANWTGIPGGCPAGQTRAGAPQKGGRQTRPPAPARYGWSA